VTLILWLWQLPQIILGVAFLAFVRVRYGRVKVERYETSWVFRYSISGTQIIWGISLGPIIILGPPKYHGEQTVKHEYGHSRQSKMLGPLYLLLVGVVSAVRCWGGYWFGGSTEWYYRGYPEYWADRLGGVMEPRQ